MNSNDPMIEGTPDPVIAFEKPRPARLDSIDFLRGLVMIIMALDHVRDFFSDRLFLDATDLTRTTPANFLTRWVTHFCAPTFIFLAGTAAFLSGTRGKSKSALSWFLFTRGVWLAFFEVVVNRIMWMFNFDWHHHGAGVFWAIGWSMVALSLLVYLPTYVVTTFGVLMIVLHNLLDNLKPADVPIPGWLWTILHYPGDATVVARGAFETSYTFGTGYCLIPWMGVMAAGYGFGTIMLLDRPTRRRCLFQLGIALTLGFILLRAVNFYGDPRTRTEQSSGYNLQLISSPDDISSIPVKAKSLVIVAAENDTLHFRIFDRDGKVVVDADETSLTEHARQIDALKTQLKNLWLPHELTNSEKDPVINAVTSIVGHSQSSPLWTFMAFLNCTKYPASLLYLLMTLGPAILALAVFDRPLGSLAKPIITFGRVPLFYYLLHIPLIHGGAVLLDYLRFGWSPLATAGPWEVKESEIPSTYGVSLPVVYLIWIGVVLILYYPCRWFAAVKQRRRDVWLSYL
ncbi:MAG TPA: heparan-alpha-glucosaminide N-acetyltransferase domain-containing protein [Gemmata sp.]|jgi:uncharacterized membrane protein|nr:heparan-alpha-glucosaminide N-acetyltransferase domain-containing protein [Gemmata sp.]